VEQWLLDGFHPKEKGVHCEDDNERRQQQSSDQPQPHLHLPNTPQFSAIFTSRTVGLRRFRDFSVPGTGGKEEEELRQQRSCRDLPLPHLALCRQSAYVPLEKIWVKPFCEILSRPNHR